LQNLRGNFLRWLARDAWCDENGKEFSIGQRLCAKLSELAPGVMPPLGFAIHPSISEVGCLT
jgi:hypothetical protein